jgi:hypothetical protein
MINKNNFGFGSNSSKVAGFDILCAPLKNTESNLFLGAGIKSGFIIIVMKGGYR